MDFVDEEHLSLIQVGEDRRQIAGTLQHRPGGGAQGGVHLVSDDVGQGGFAQTRRAEEQHVVQGFSTLHSRLDRHPQVFHHPLLADILLEASRAQGGLEPQVIDIGGAREQARVF